MIKPVFVDQLQDWGWRLGESCHLLPYDESRESMSALHAVATLVGMKPKWFQNTRWPHYDLTAGRRAAALIHGVIEISTSGYLRMRKAHMAGAFVEPGSGLVMELGKWYLLSDSGSFYSARGYVDARKARRAALRLKNYDLKPDDVGVVGVALPPGDGMGYLCNIVLADDLLLFWAKEAPLELRRRS